MKLDEISNNVKEVKETVKINIPVSHETKEETVESFFFFCEKNGLFAHIYLLYDKGNQNNGGQNNDSSITKAKNNPKHKKLNKKRRT